MKHLERTKQELDNFVRGYKPSSAKIADSVANGMAMAEKVVLIKNLHHEIDAVYCDNLLKDMIRHCKTGDDLTTEEYVDALEEGLDINWDYNNAS